MRYQLHDSQVDGLIMEENRILFTFSQGFWKTDENGKQVEQMHNCQLVFYIEKGDALMEDCIFVRLSKKGKTYKTVALRTFIGLLRKSAFDVDMEYDCAFSNRKMLQLYSNSLQTRVEIFIEEIQKVEYIHD